MPIEASVGTLDVENATLRASGLVATTNLAVGRPALKDLNPPTLEIFSEGVPSLELHSNTLNLANSSNAFARFTASAEKLVIQSGTSTANDSKGDIAFSGVNDVTRYMTIKGSTGRVGIGTTNPDKGNLTVYGLGADPFFTGFVEGNYADPSDFTGLSHIHSSGSHGVLRISNTSGNTGSTRIDFNTVLGAYWLQNTTINSNFRGTAPAAGRIMVTGERADNYEDAYMSFHVCFDPKVDGTGGTGNLYERMRIAGNGNVGIGTTDPTAKLEVGHYGSEIGDFTALRMTNFATNLHPSVLAEYNLIVSDINSGTGLGNGNFAISYRDGKSDPLLHRLVIDSGGNVGIGTATPKTTYDTPVLEVYQGAILTGRRNTSSDTNYSLYVGQGVGDGWLTGYTPTGSHVFAFYNTNPNSGGWNSAVTSFYINKNTSTNRSINAAGTINANGSDYAEYIRKKNVHMVINKGDIIGINSNAYLTNVFSESVTFAVKTTDPALVGGDTWGVDLDMYGPKKPKELYPEASEEEINTYNLDMQKYETEKQVWEEQHDNARKPYDRIAFCGQVPVNVYNATPGQYIIPSQTDDDTISYELTNTPTFEQYQISIGKVIKIQEDGRAWIIVKIS